MVLTNRHVIPSREVASKTMFIFDPGNDQKSFETTLDVYMGCRKIDCKLDELNKETLDFTAVFLKTNKDDDDEFLEARAVSVSDQDIKPPKHCIILSYPIKDNLDLCIGQFQRANRNKTHIEHDIPTDKGSSGAPLLYFSRNPEPHWVPVFLHYSKTKLKCKSCAGIEFEFECNRAISITIIMRKIKEMRKKGLSQHNINHNHEISGLERER